MSRPSEALGRYRIEYLKRGGGGFVQYKDLISHHDYEDVIKPSRQKIDQLYVIDRHSAEAKALERELWAKFGDDWFTDRSPWYDAISTGNLVLPEIQGGTFKVKITKE